MQGILFNQNQNQQGTYQKSKIYNELKVSEIQQNQLNILASKSKIFKQVKRRSENFDRLPEAKPLLSKFFIDFSKPKVLIKQILINKQPDQLSSSNKISTIESTSPCQKKAVHAITHENPVQYLTLWQKYIIKSGYECIYLKYYRGNLKDFYPKQTIKGMKDQRTKLKHQLLKMCHNNENLFNTYLIDLDFITEAGTSLIRNLTDNNLHKIYQKWQHQYTAQDQTTHNINQLIFDSKFQSANLFAVFQKIDNKTFQPTQHRTYELILQNDINTKGYSNWFYFSIKSRQKGTLKLNIVNMQKSYSLFNNGMKVFVFSYQRYKQQQVEWHRDGFEYSYRKNQLIKEAESNIRYNTLSFCVQQKYQNDILFISANLPYTYSRLISFLSSTQRLTKLNPHIYFKRQSTIQSISSNICPLLTLTWKRDKKEKTSTKKKIIVLIARQHPGETVSSWVMEGLINSLVQLRDQNVVALLKNYIFKIVPMLNVDGVVYGNSRCDITGTDINRKWTRAPNHFLYPILSSIRKLCQQMTVEGHQIDYFIDLHGHSKKYGSFIYSCKMIDQIQTRCFSWLISKITNKFSFQNCTFGLSSFKKDTARGSLCNFITNKKSMTIETSFMGYKKFNVVRFFEIKDFYQIGQNLLSAIIINQNRDPKLFNWTNIKSQIKNYLENNQKLQTKSQQSESGSDSDPSQDQMTLEEKTASFLPSTLISKIGLVQIKIVEKRKKKSNSIQIKKKDNIENQDDLGISRFDEKQVQQGNYDQNKLSSYFSKKMDNVQNKINRLRQTKSVTKISPFKLSERSRKSISTTKIRLAIDIKYIQNRQKLSIPLLLPQIQEKQAGKKRNNFWQSFNKQYQNLINQKKTLQGYKKAQSLKK